MFKTLRIGLFFYGLTSASAKEADLPLCPTNVLYLPQNLPMHCRMPTNVHYSGYPGQIPTIPPFFQSLPPDKQPIPISIPVPPGVPGPIPMPAPLGMPGSISAPAPVPLPAPYPMSLPGAPAHKLPVIVMPFYSPDPSFKKHESTKIHSYPIRPRKWAFRHKYRKPFYYSSDLSSDLETDSDTDWPWDFSSEYKGWWRDRRNHRRSNRPNKAIKRKHNQKRELLTPVLQYVTKDGYVIYEKRITKNEAKDWLQVKSKDKIDSTTRVSTEVEDANSSEPNDNHSREKETVGRETVPVVKDGRLTHPNRVKLHKNKANRKTFSKLVN